MKLFTCPAGTTFGAIGHPCGRAARALSRAGHEFDIEAVKGFKNIPGALKHGDRAEIERLTGQRGVPVLLLDDGSTVVGSGTIVRWAKDNAES